MIEIEDIKDLRKNEIRSIIKTIEGLPLYLTDHDYASAEATRDALGATHDLDGFLDTLIYSLTESSKCSKCLKENYETNKELK